MMAVFGGRGIARDLLDAAAARRPDLVVVDCLMVGAIRAAARYQAMTRLLQRIVDAGAGRVLPRSATTDEMAPVPAEVLAHGPHRVTAARLELAIRSVPGATNGADALEELVRDGEQARGRPAARP